MKPRLWITYAHLDNESQNVDYVIEQLDRCGLDVHFDRRTLVPGQRLWSQIGGTITDPALCGAWAIVVTANSLKSPGCMEELEYALLRATATNGPEFPLIALLHQVPARELPPALRVRLAVSLSDPRWTEQVSAGVERRGAGFKPCDVPPYLLAWHKSGGGAAAGLEVRPRLESIAPFFVIVDLEEHTSGNVPGVISGCPGLFTGAPGRVPTNFHLQGYVGQETVLSDPRRTRVWAQSTDEAASPSRSYYLICDRPPRRVWVGSEDKLTEIRLGAGPAQTP